MLSALVAALLSLGAAGCEGEEVSQVDTRQSPVVTWTNLQLLHNWQSFGPGYTPQVAIINGTVTFKGALNGTNANSDVAFNLDGSFSQFRPVPMDNVSMRTVLANDKGGTIWCEFPINAPTTMPVHVVQDGVGFNQLGPDVGFASLDGVAFDQGAGTARAYNFDHWASMYGFRQSPLGICPGSFPDCGLYAKTQDGFVRFQGALMIRNGIDNFDGLVATLPANLRPGQMVSVPVSLGITGPPDQHLGVLTINPNGNVVMAGSTYGALGGMVFEGAAYSLTNMGNQALPLASNWVAYNNRQVKVGNFGGVVRFQGAIKNGNSIQLATVPAGLRPSKTVKVVGNIMVGVAWQVTIIVEPTGFMWFQGAPLNYAATYLSLDSVSYPL